ncbi:MAG: MgtC/SapB family protein [Methylomonas sp.]|jgi:putative Mg2+ transporter-C (MgtC) family protein
MSDLQPITMHIFNTYWSKPELEVNLIILLNIFGALLLGMVVGYERAYHGRAAGMRTYGLVCMASSAVTVILSFPHYWFGGLVHLPESSDPTRVIQGLVTGIGFLGAGVIMKEGLNISGLTTAASIWASCSIGILCGAGFYLAAIALTLISAALMIWGGELEAILPSRHILTVNLFFKPDYQPVLENIRRFFADLGFQLDQTSLTIIHGQENEEWRLTIIAGRNHKQPAHALAAGLQACLFVNAYQIAIARN